MKKKNKIQLLFRFTLVAHTCDNYFKADVVFTDKTVACETDLYVVALQNKYRVRHRYTLARVQYTIGR